MFERTRHYYEAVKNYRQKLTDIWAAYDAGMKGLEKYKGSDGYSKEAAELERKRLDAIKATQDEYRAHFANIVQYMRESATTRSMDTPTEDALRLLSALQMRQKISRDELEQAGRTLKDCPVALSVLDEIAEKMEYHGMRFAAESTDSVLKHINTLADSAARLCKLDKPTSRADMAARASVHSPNYDHNAFYSYRVDQDPADVKDAMRTFGDVGDYDSFAAAVNN